jgi:hypothetical protein
MTTRGCVFGGEKARVTFGLFNFFGRFASRDGGRFETTDAIHAGDKIHDELLASERKR